MQRTHQLFAVLLSALCLLVLTSAAVVPPATTEAAPPVEKATQSKKAQRQQAKLERLRHRLDKSTNARQKMRIQHKIDRHQQSKDAGVVLGIVALIFAFVFAPVGLILAIVARNDGGGFIADLAFWISLIILVAALVVLILSLLGTIRFRA